MPVAKELLTWTVLIVDDEQDNLGVAEKILAFYGARVHTAKNGLEGMKVLETVTPTLILLDLSMPQMDGWQMLKALREDSRNTNVPVIALTAHAMPGDRERVLEAGFDDYITKPFRLMSFVSDIKQSLQRSGRQPITE